MIIKISRENQSFNWEGKTYHYTYFSYLDNYIIFWLTNINKDILKINLQWEYQIYINWVLRWFSKEYKTLDPLYQEKYYKKNKTRIQQYWLNYYKKHKEEIKKKSLAYYYLNS